MAFFIINLTLKFGAVRLYSGVANLALNCDCSNSFDFRDMAFFMIFSFFFQNLRYKKLSEHQFLNPIVGCCLGKIRVGKSGVPL